MVCPVVNCDLVTVEGVLCEVRRIVCVVRQTTMTFFTRK